MKPEEFFKKIFSFRLWINLFAMIVFIVLLCLVLKFGIDIYTHHGEEISIPNIKHKNFADAEHILENAGIPYENIMQSILDANNFNYGYNARTLQLTDLLLDGIIDPVKVLTGTVYAASSIASVILTSSCIITTDPIENNGLSLNMMPTVPMM